MDLIEQFSVRPGRPDRCGGGIHRRDSHWQAADERHPVAAGRRRGLGTNAA